MESGTEAYIFNAFFKALSAFIIPSNYLSFSGPFSRDTFDGDKSNLHIQFFKQKVN